MSIVVSSSSLSAKTVDGLLNDWIGKKEGIYGVQLYNSEDSIYLTLTLPERDFFIPIQLGELVFFIPNRLPTLLWLDADNNPQTGMLESYFSKGADVIFSADRVRDGEVIIMGKSYTNGNEGVLIASNDTQTTYEIKIPKHLIGRYTNYFNQPKVWITVKPNSNNADSELKVANRSRVTNMKALPKKYRHVKGGNVARYTGELPFIGMNSNDFVAYVAVAKATELVEEADQTEGVVGVGGSADVFVGTISVGVYYDEGDGFGGWGQTTSGPTGFALNAEAWAAPYAEKEHIEGFSLDVKAPLVGPLSLSQSMPIRDGEVQTFGRGHTYNASLKIRGISLPLSQTVSVSRMWLEPFNESEISAGNNSSSGSSGSGGGNGGSSTGNSGGGTSTKPPGNGPDSGRGPGGYTPMN